MGGMLQWDSVLVTSRDQCTSATGRMAETITQLHRTSKSPAVLPLLICVLAYTLEHVMHDDAFFERQARLCGVLADPKRLRLLEALRDGERSVGELVELLGASYPNVSQHLNGMRDAGVVLTRKAGTTVFYRLAYPRLMDACDIVHEVLRAQLTAERRLGQRALAIR